MQVDFLHPRVTDEDIEEVVRVLKSGWLLLQQETERFEKEFATYMRSSDAVLTNSCACSIHLALLLGGLQEGDEVITTALSYNSTANPILHQSRAGAGYPRTAQ